MALTNAERQARHRQRVAARLREAEAPKPAGPDPRDEEIARLRAENAQLRARPAAGNDGHLRNTIEMLRRQIARLKRELRIPLVEGAAEMDAHVRAIGKRVPADDVLGRALLQELLVEVRVHAPAKIAAIHRTVERKLAKLAARLPSKVEARRLKIAALAAAGSGATDGERASAIAALARR